jgi:hypothetical protein
MVNAPVYQRVKLLSMSVVLACLASFGLSVSANANANVNAAAASSSAAVTTSEATYVYTTKAGDTLIGLSNRLLVQPSEWPVLQKLNRIKDPRAIPVGTALQIPTRMLRMADAPAEVISVTGTVTSAGKALKVGDKVAPGIAVETNDSSYATLKLADGTEVLIQSSSKVELATSRQGTDVSVFDLLVKLVFGRTETRAVKKSAGDRLEIATPTATMGVRGTVFRVSTLDEKTATSEVLEGLVAARSLTEQAQVALNAGFGTKVEAGKPPSPPIQLLAAPKLADIPALYERTVIRFTVPPVAGATKYRAQFALDEGFKQVVAETLSAQAEVKAAGVPDGKIYVKVRAIDSLGLEGNDSVKLITMKARPEPPIIAAPLAKAKLSAGQLSLEWTQSVDATSYRLQVARDVGFSQLINNETNLTSNRYDGSKLAVGEYFWRVASNKGSDNGPWGDASSFNVRPTPQPVAPTIDGKQMQLAFTGEPGQQFEIQIATDPEFGSIVNTQKLQQSTAKIELPGIGVYYIRYRTIDADGFTSPFGASQKVEVVGRPWWLL